MPRLPRPVRPVLLLAAASVVAACSASVPEAPRATAPAAPSPSPTASTPGPWDDVSARERGRALLEAARRGALGDVTSLLEAGTDPEVRDGRGRTPLLLAVTEDHVAVVRRLVDAGADPDALDDRHDTPWLVTGVTGSVDAARVLLTADPDLTIRNRFGGVAHIPASERGHADYVDFVLARTDIEVDHVNDLGWTALLEAVVLGRGTDRWQRIVTALLDAGADPSVGDAQGVTPLQHARSRGQADVVRLLEAGGAS